MIVDSKFKPAWWMRNRHAQTIIPRLYPKPCDFQPLFQDFELSDGDFVELTWTQKPDSIPAGQPIVLVLHGLEGSFDSFYAKRMMNAMHQQGWTAVLMHFRGCGQKPNRKIQSYHSGQTADVREFAEFLSLQFPQSSLYGVGFSLGGNVLAKYLGECVNNPFSAGVVISAPLQLDECATSIGTGFSKVYQKYLIDKLVASTHEKIDCLKGAEPAPISKEKLDSLVTLIEFDEHITAPINGFEGAQDYYLQSSAKQYLKYIKTPTLIIHAKDDPFMNEKVIPSLDELSSDVILELSESGGHVGFLSGRNPLKPEFWTETRSVEYIKTIMETKK
jgi:predicted alpha/beta-fold hydrolase